MPLVGALSQIDPAGPHLLHVELVATVRRAVVVERPVEALGDVAVADEEQEVDAADLEARVECWLGRHVGGG